MVAIHQGPRRHAFISVVVEGVGDVTNRLRPYLISVTVTDKIAKEVDECVIELDDRNAELAIPEDGQMVRVSMGWSNEGPRIDDPPPPEVSIPELPFGGGGMHLVFRGTITSVESGGGRSRAGGRRLWIEAKGWDNTGDGKGLDMDSWGVGDQGDNADSGGSGMQLGSVFEQAAQKAGLNAKISPSMKSIARDFWFQNEPFSQFGNRLASELGGYFKINGKDAVLIGADGLNADGQPMGVIDAWWGVNLITWRIKPFVGRPQFAGHQNIFFDIAGGIWKNVQQSVGGELPFGRSKAMGQLPGSAPNRQIGDQNNGGPAQAGKDSRGTGWAILNGEPLAKAGKRLRIFGARPGVDGSWFIQEAEHIYSRNGYTTRCQLNDPQLDPGVYKDMGWNLRGGLVAPQAPTPRPDVALPDVVIEGMPATPAEPGAPAPTPQSGTPEPNIVIDGVST